MAHEEAMRLIVLRGLEGRREYVLKGDALVVGRPGAAVAPDIAIDAPDVLERHAELRREGGTFRLDPMPGARVLVNRREFQGGLLNDGDQVAFGGALFQFWAGGLKGEAPRPYDAPDARAASSASSLPMPLPSVPTRAPARLAVAAVVIIGVAAAIALVVRQFAQRPLP